MRCYVSKNKEEFIKRYGKLDGNLYILDANNTVKTEKYTVSREKELLEKMRGQIIKERENSNMEETLKCVLAHSVGTAFCELPFLNSIISGNSTALTYAGTSLLTLFLAVNLYKLPNLILNVKDLNKNVYFIDNEKVFEEFNKFNLSYLKNISGYAKKKIKDSEKINPLDLNFIEDLSIKDIEKINENISNLSHCLVKGVF